MVVRTGNWERGGEFQFNLLLLLTKLCKALFFHKILNYYFYFDFIISYRKFYGKIRKT